VKVNLEGLARAVEVGDLSPEETAFMVREMIRNWNEAQEEIKRLEGEAERAENELTRLRSELRRRRIEQGACPECGSMGRELKAPPECVGCGHRFEEPKP
jgi:rubrerythrin